VPQETLLLAAGSRSSTGSVFQTVGPRQRRPADRVCYVDTAERSSGSRSLIFDVDLRRRRPECSSWPDTLVLCSPDTDGPWQPACTPRVLDRWASGVGRESTLTDHGHTCECCWQGGPPHSGCIVKCPLRTGVLRWTLRCSSPPATRWQHAVMYVFVDYYCA